MPLFASELVERGDDSAPSTPTTTRVEGADESQVPPPLPPSPTRVDEDDAVVVAAPVSPPAVPAYDETEDLAPYPSTRCSPISIESLASALEALGVPLTVPAGTRPTSPANKSERRHTMKPHTLAPSPPSANSSSSSNNNNLAVSSPTKASGAGSAVGARRAAAKEKRKTATLAQTH
jgi:hypothetical protein